MSGKTFLPVLILFFSLFLMPHTGSAGMPFFGRGGGSVSSPDSARISKGGMFPAAGDVEDLTPISNVLTYKNDNFEELYGEAGKRYLQYGMQKLMSANYIYGAKDRRISLEIVTMDTAMSAAGLFHYHRGKILHTPGEEVDIGAEGVLDVGRDKRNLYFYRSNLFVKVVYSGPDPVPDLTPIGRYVDSKLPSGRDAKVDGVDYIGIEGVDVNSIEVTPGYTFNLSFLPPSVWASAPGAGSPASDLYIVTRVLDRDAQELFKDYTSYLKLHAKYVEEYVRDGRKHTKAVDPNQGRVVFTCYRNALILMARPDGYEKGEVLIDRVIEKIDEVKGAVKGGKKGKDEGGGKRRRFNIFRRNK